MRVRALGGRLVSFTCALVSVYAQGAFALRLIWLCHPCMWRWVVGLVPLGKGEAEGGEALPLGAWFVFWLGWLG